MLLESLTDYSQGGEQALILKSLEGIAAGRFLDIGAFNAKALSNTRALYEMGWGGVVVEPSPGPVKGLIQEYGTSDRVIVVAAAVGLDRHMVKFHATDDALSTSESRNLEIWKERGGFYGTWYVPMVTLHEIMHQFGAFDFVNIDTEGTSLQLLEALLATEMKPRCISVEHDGQMHEAVHMGTRAGYLVRGATSENLIFSL